MGRVYAVVSAKGGVGKTTTTTNLAAALAASGADVAVVDGDLGMANLAGSLGVASGGATLHDVLAGEAELAEATRTGPHGMTVVPGSPELDAFARADPEGLREVLAALADDHDYVLLDTGAGLSNDTVVPLTYVDEVILVSTTGRDALGDTEKTRQVAERLDVPVAGAVITRVDPDNPGKEAVESTLNAPVLTSIPRADVVRDAGDVGEPLTTYAPGSSAAAAYRALAGDLTGESVRRDDGDEAATGGDEATTDATDSTATDATDEPPESVESEVEAGDADAGEDEDIIVAGDHEADGEPDGVDADGTDADGDATADAADTDETDVDADETDAVDAAEPVDDDPLIERDDASVEPVSSVEPVETDADAGDVDDDPLIETAEPLDESGDIVADDDGDDTDDDAETPADADAPDDDADESLEDGESPDDAGEDSGDADETDGDEDAADAEADEEDEEEGVYTTSLADEEDEEEEEKEKKGLFGRFLG